MVCRAAEQPATVYGRITAASIHGFAPRSPLGDKDPILAIAFCLTPTGSP